MSEVKPFYFDRHEPFLDGFAGAFLTDIKVVSGVIYAPSEDEARQQFTTYVEEGLWPLDKRGKGRDKHMTYPDKTALKRIVGCYRFLDIEGVEKRPCQNIAVVTVRHT